MQSYFKALTKEIDFLPTELIEIISEYSHDELLNLLKENGLYEYYYEPEEYVEIPKEFTRDYLNNFLEKERKIMQECKKQYFKDVRIYHRNFKCKNNFDKNRCYENCNCFSENHPKVPRQNMRYNISKFKRIYSNKIQKKFIPKTIEDYYNKLDIITEIENSFDYDFRKLKNEFIKYYKNTNQYKDTTRIEKYYKYTCDSLQELISLFGISDDFYEKCNDYSEERYYLLNFLKCDDDYDDYDYFNKFVFDNLVLILTKFLIYSKQKMIDESFKHFHD